MPTFLRFLINLFQNPKFDYQRKYKDEHSNYNVHPLLKP